MNTAQTPSTEPTSTPNTNPVPPQDIDSIIDRFLERANKVAANENTDPKAVCSLGWLVLKIKQFQVENQSRAKTDAQPGGLSDNTVRQIEQAAKML